MLKITIEGTNYALQHKYLVTTISDPNPRSQITDYSDEWKKGTYLNDKGNVIWPWQNIIASVFDGCKGERLGKLYLTRLVYTSFRVIEDAVVKIKGNPITLKDIEENELWRYSIGAVVSGRRVDRVRTMLPVGWKAEFSAIYFKPFTKELVERVVKNAGVNAGIGDWRPSAPKKPGPYGMYNLVSITEEKDK